MNCTGCNRAISAGARFCGACGQAVTPAAVASGAAALERANAQSILGSVIADQYLVHTKIGEGGMGAVYQAEQISLKRKVALKLLRSELSSDPALVARFNAEAQLAAKLNHPNTVTLYDFGQNADGSLFIAMEFIEGQSLRDVITQEGAVPVGRALTICRQIADSLADAHTAGIVHRDLKPDNVMLRSRGRRRDIVTVLDFGIAKLRDERADGGMPITQAGDLLGTPQYMAPEQIRAEQVDGRTDIYALGALLYEMLTGLLPFEAPTVMALLGMHLTATPIPPRQRNPRVALSPTLEQLVLACLNKEPGARPASMDAFLERLKQCRQQLGGHSEDVSAQLDTAPLTGAAGAAASVTPTGGNSAMPNVGGASPTQAATPTAQPAPGSRPPGVPITVPPIPGIALPPQPPAPATPPPMVTPAGGSSSNWLIWTVVGLMLLTGAGVFTFLAVRDNGSPADNASPADNSGDLGGSKTPRSHSPGITFEHPNFGYQIAMPPGFVQTHPVPEAAFKGTVDGREVLVTTFGEALSVALFTKRQLQRTLRAFAKQRGCTIEHMKWRKMAGVKNVLSGGGMCHVQGIDLQYAFAAYKKRRYAALVTVSTAPDDFDATAGFRQQLFDNVVTTQ